MHNVAGARNYDTTPRPCKGQSTMKEQAPENRRGMKKIQCVFYFWVNGEYRPPTLEATKIKPRTNIPTLHITRNGGGNPVAKKIEN